MPPKKKSTSRKLSKLYQKKQRRKSKRKKTEEPIKPADIKTEDLHPPFQYLLDLPKDYPKVLKGHSLRVRTRTIRTEFYRIINVHLLVWLQRCITYKVPVTNKFVKLLAYLLALKMNITDFQPSNLWLFSMRRGFNLDKDNILNYFFDDDRIWDIRMEKKCTKALPGKVMTQSDILDAIKEDIDVKHVDQEPKKMYKFDNGVLRTATGEIINSVDLYSFVDKSRPFRQYINKKLLKQEIPSINNSDQDFYANLQIKQEYDDTQDSLPEQDDIRLDIKVEPEMLHEPSFNAHYYDDNLSEQLTQNVAENPKLPEEKQPEQLEQSEQTETNQLSLDPLCEANTPNPSTNLLQNRALQEFNGDSYETSIYEEGDTNPRNIQPSTVTYQIYYFDDPKKTVQQDTSTENSVVKTILDDFSETRRHVVRVKEEKSETPSTLDTVQQIHLHPEVTDSFNLLSSDEPDSE